MRKKLESVTRFQKKKQQQQQQQLPRRNARQQRVHVTVLSTYTGMTMNCPFNCPTTPSNYKHDAYTVLLLLKSGW